jgi:preprotein translocase subunit SecE
MKKEWKLVAGKTGRPPVKNKMLDELAAAASRSEEERKAVQTKLKIEHVEKVERTNRKDLKIVGGVVLAVVIIFILFLLTSK